MCQKAKSKVPTTAIFRSRIAKVAVTLIASCLLPSATYADLGDPRELKATVDVANFDMPAAAPDALLAVSRQLNANLDNAGTADAPTFAPGAFIFPPLQIKAALQTASVEIAPAAPVNPPAASVVRPLIAHQIDADKPAPARSGFFARLETSVARINFDTPALAPMSFVRFCVQHPQDCKVGQVMFRPRPVVATKARMAELAKVNREVNRAIKPMASSNGVLAEEWLISPNQGDCKDYAVTKRHELLARGWPSRSLLLAEVVVASGEHHVVLVVRTRQNDFVLDNLNWNVRPVSQVDYQWVRAQQASNPKFWSAISVAGATRVAMNSR